VWQDFAVCLDPVVSSKDGAFTIDAKSLSDVVVDLYGPRTEFPFNLCMKRDDGEFGMASVRWVAEEYTETVQGVHCVYRNGLAFKSAPPVPGHDPIISIEIPGICVRPVRNDMRALAQTFLDRNAEAKRSVDSLVAELMTRAGMSVHEMPVHGMPVQTVGFDANGSEVCE